jgi:RND family efflux transporter MFP subunit
MLTRFDKRLLLIISVVLLILFTLVTLRIWAAIMLRYNTHEQAILNVRIIKATPTQASYDIQLPGILRAWHEAPIYARANGYIKNWYVDIGDRVTAGQVLADIETPELDAQLHQVKAQLRAALANDKIAQLTAARWKNLVKSDWVSKQTTDEKIDSAKATAAFVLAARAEHQRLKQLVAFEQVVAPFSGIITERNIDIGTLINAGFSPQAKPLFQLVQNSPLRLYVNIPQNDASHITPNMSIDLTLMEYPGQVFKATLLNTAQAIAPKTGTLLAEFLVNNKKGRLLPGSYTQTHLLLPAQIHSFRLPVNALLFRAQGLQVATLDKHNKVVLKSVTIHHDLGREVEINSGITANDRIIINPNDSITTGEQVRVKKSN